MDFKKKDFFHALKKVIDAHYFKHLSDLVLTEQETRQMILMLLCV